ncbi:exocyst complex component SEC6-like [Papaver somniferum]|uniref:exocyst complex component SEC6-like n=1 Tax=Papaver somniferum TaxID=3469 RepID=UPI000E6F9E53|nr:exocyst complex component SEC6-like [Papaver somniferum]
MMVREDCGIEDKEAAVREAYKLLPLPELLASTSSWIKSRYIARQQVDQTRSALEALSLSQKTINSLVVYMETMLTSRRCRGNDVNFC